MSNLLKMMMAEAGGVATVTNTANAVDPANLTVYNGVPFQGLSFGDAAADRKMVITVEGGQGDNGKTVSSVTVGGVGATFVKGQSAPVESSLRTEIWQADVPTGATGDVVVTWSAGVTHCGIGVFRVLGAQASASNTAGNSDDPMVATIDIPANGICIGVGYASTTGVFVWTNLSEQYQHVIESPKGGTAASDEFATAQTGRSITCDPDAATSRPTMSLASWAPA